MSTTLPTSDETDPPAALVELLEGAPDTRWPDDEPPTVARLEETARSERGPGHGQPVELYVWAPDGGDAEPHSADYDALEQTETLQVQAWALEEGEAFEYREAALAFLAEYGNDNEAHTPFHRIRPTATSDLRSEHVRRQTNHYVMGLDVRVQRFRPL